MSAPRPPSRPNPSRRWEAEDPRHADPLHVAELEDDAFDQGYAAAEGDRRWRLAGLLLAALSGALIGAVLAVAVVR